MIGKIQVHVLKTVVLENKYKQELLKLIKLMVDQNVEI
jgi:hypothetical protein